jgi:hypothetical protein
MEETKKKVADIIGFKKLNSLEMNFIKGGGSSRPPHSDPPCNHHRDWDCDGVPDDLA